MKSFNVEMKTDIYMTILFAILFPYMLKINDSSSYNIRNDIVFESKHVDFLNSTSENQCHFDSKSRFSNDFNGFVAKADFLDRVTHGFLI